METTIRSAPIPWCEAVRLITNFVKNASTFELAKISIGGTFPIEDFLDSTNGHVASQFWFCFNQLNTKHPKLFLALENVKSFWDSRKVPSEPSYDPLVRSLDPFAFPTNYTRDETGVINFLKGNFNTSNGVRSITKRDVFDYSISFKSLFGDNEEGYCKYPIAYFVDKTFDLSGNSQNYIQQFLNQTAGNVKYLRYYFGLENESIDYPNRIRVILFPVNESGDNIIVDVMPERGGSVILQKSFPPPPDN